MDGWTEAGTIAAIVAAVAGVAAVMTTVVYGWRGERRSDEALRRSDDALRYQRLREARDLIHTMRVTADNARFKDCNEAGAQLRLVLGALRDDLPAAHALAAKEWELNAYPELPAMDAAARSEVEAALTPA